MSWFIFRFQVPIASYPRIGFACVAAMIVILGRSEPGLAQVRWQIVGANGGINGNADANELPVTGPAAISDTCAIAAGTAFQAGVTGTGGVVHEYGLRCLREVEDRAIPPAGPPAVWVQAVIKARAFIDGDNTSQVTIEWLNLGYCDQSTDGHIADANMALAFDVSLQIVNGPIGAPVIVLYSWDGFGGASTDHECPIPGVCVVEEDAVQITNTLSIGRNGGAGRELLGGRFDFASPPGVSGWNQKSNQGGAIAANVGDTINISVNSNGLAHLQSPEPVGIQVGPECDVRFDGMLRLSVGFVPPPSPPLPPLLPPQPEFSLDIGSDAEMSDAPFDGNEYFDPGDCYSWGGQPMPIGGQSGFRDDTLIFAGVDVEPHAPDLAIPPASAAPVCNIVGSPLFRWFDLDGTDALDFSLIPFLGPAQGPISFFPSSCIYSTQNLAISFDDDGPSPYDISCSVPTNSASQNWSATFGSTANRDEVYYVQTFDAISSPRAVPMFASPIAAEAMVHSALAPNPLGSQDANDDVDALDFVVDATICTVWYFSADHEAPGVHPTYGMPLDPGNIYEVAGVASPSTVVDHAVHLGLPDRVDVRDFEFVWLYNEPVNQIWLALIFSVAPDDPITPYDDSAGLDPTTIYASFLDGLSFPFLTSPLGENIDAIATWSNSLITPTDGACCGPNGCTLAATAGQCAASGGQFRGFGTDCADVNSDGYPDTCECLGCRCDMNGDTQINGADMQAFSNCMTSGGGSNCYCADMDGNATWDTNDIDLFELVLLYGSFQSCP